jgi:hypothetical protein
MRRCVLLGSVAALLAAPSPAAAQRSNPGSNAASLTFEAWEASLPTGVAAAPTMRALGEARPNRTRRALIGGAIGATAGVVACTVISTLADDSADGGLSFCPLDTYLLIGGAGFVAGAAVGWLF